MNKDMEMLHHLAHESKQPLYRFRKYTLSARVREIFRKACYKYDVNSERNLKIILDVHSGLKGKEMANKYNASKLIFLGSACSYPRNVDQPILENLDPLHGSFRSSRCAAG